MANPQKVSKGTFISQSERDQLLANAERRLTAMQCRFKGWLAQQVEELESTHIAFREKTDDETLKHALSRHAHDLKGQADTFGYPVITRMATSLCRLLGAGDISSPVRMRLLNGHVAAIKAAARTDTQQPDDPLIAELLQEFEKQINATTRKTAQTQEQKNTASPA